MPGLNSPLSSDETPADTKPTVVSDPSNVGLDSTQTSPIPITLKSSQESSLTVYPERGGIATSLILRGREILYQGMLDTLFDRSKSVKGGIPILFPNAGPLTEEEKARSGYSLPQHGFARLNPWRVVSESPSGIRLSLDSSEVKEFYGYNWDGEVIATMSVQENACSLGYELTNRSDVPMPISFGLHPYFDVPLGDKSAIEWNFEGGVKIADEQEVWSNDGTTKLDMPKDGILRIMIPGIANLKIVVSPQFKRLWIWSLPGENLVCIEPVMGDEGTIVNNPPYMIPPRGEIKLNMTISLE